MDAERRRRLGIFLNDHLAGSTAAIGRARATRDANEGTEFFEPLVKICREIEEDRSGLERIIDQIGTGRSKVKPAVVAFGEKAGRLKPNGQLHGYSPLGRVIDLEVLLLGITGKLRLWTLLGGLDEGDISEDLGELAARAERQRAEVELLQSRAAELL